MKKTVSALALAGSLALLGAAGAQANHDTDYPSSPVSGTVSDGIAQVVVNAEAGGAVVADGRGTKVEALANTGLNPAMLIWGAAGVGALVLGAGTVAAARRRASVAA